MTAEGPENGHPKAAMDVVYSAIHRRNHATSTTAEVATDVLDALRAMPVEDRMEAMGMTRWDDVAGYEPGSMVPVFIERDTDV